MPRIKSTPRRNYVRPYSNSPINWDLLAGRRTGLSRIRRVGSGIYRNPFSIRERALNNFGRLYQRARNTRREAYRRYRKYHLFK